MILSLNDVLVKLESGNPCLITLVTCDKHRKKGGRIETWECRLNKHSEGSKTQDVRLKTEQVADIREQQGKQERNRRAHFTRNVVLMQNGRDTHLKRDIHPPLIIEMDGCEVIP
jgi:5-methylcytosine-specific restriction endonuclease McrA